MIGVKLEFLGCLSGDAGGSAEEEDWFFGCGADRGHEVGAGDAFF